MPAAARPKPPRAAWAAVTFAWLAVILVAGCAEDNSPQAVCERRAYDDPTVKELIALGAGSPYLLAENQDALRRARSAATNRCLQERGIIRPGGVEMVIPPR